MAFIALAMLLGLALTGLGAEGDTVSEGSASSEKYTGTEGDDRFDAAAGNDLVLGQAGDDSLSGGEGNDWLLGATGADTLTGGSGDDVIVGGAGTDRIEAGAGNDFAETADIVDTPKLEISSQSAESFGDIDFLYDIAAGSDEGDEVSLGSGHDTVIAGSDDTVTTGEGNDHISLGDWIEEGKPIHLQDFESGKDVIVYTYANTTNQPHLDIVANNPLEQIELRANGKTFAILQSTVSDFSMKDVRLLSN